MKTKLKVVLTLLLALVVQFSFAQEKTVTGTVSDDSGPLPGVSISVKGTTRGTDTDFNGKYSIKAKTGDVLSFSYLGYETATKKIGERIPDMLGDIEVIKRDDARFDQGKILKSLNKRKTLSLGGPPVANAKDDPKDRYSKYLGESFFETTEPSLLATLEKRSEVIDEQRKTNRRA